MKKIVSDYSRCIYAMGSKEKLKKDDCSYHALAKGIIALENMDDKDFDSDDMKSFINGEAKELAPIFYRKDGGYLSQIKSHLNIDLELFDKDNFIDQCEKYKILCMFYMLKEKYNKEVIQLLGEPSMENIDNSSLGWKTKNGDIIHYIINLLEKELSEQYTKNVRKSLFYITSSWEESLDGIRYQMDYYAGMGYEYDFEEVIHLLKSVPYDSSIDNYNGYGNLSPIAVLYLRIMQLQQIGQIKDIIEINKIPIESNYNVPIEMVEEMKNLSASKIKVSEIEKYIDKNTSKIDKYVYLKEEVSKGERKKIRYHKEKVPIIYDFCIRARPLLSMEDVSTELFIISCLQAIILDSSNEIFDYIFHGYQDHMKHKPPVQGALKSEEPTVDALKIYWERKVLDHWYANIGRYDLRCDLRRLENLCDDILLQILDYPNFDRMLKIHSLYHGRLLK